ncbi:nucleotide sugar dehydrogenase [Chryseobacterium sp. HSC-36S06]|uniref:nucleotide sugar dehydrogenase n=1 Tax=Chryseobacterium sp. HSC-36S06 TaxID=2910970 RepID=UPI0020A1A0B7|nr:nucleotide sugar dehydrogenase [Chryseobacterium sp. HSC-36S06]MCP2037668.1 UDP-N-acetyl-D-galactosamine dehydrogenase [Chryseobacterium sp. HSC-36S06]
MTHKIAIIGLGYVGLPLARLFATKYPVVGFDINQQRIAELNAGTDLTLEVEEELLKSVLVNENPFVIPSVSEESHSEGMQSTSATGKQDVSDIQHPASNTHHPSPNTQQTGLYCTHELSDIAEANTYIITVPTPVDKNNKPDLTPLYKASETVGKVLKKGDIVIYESTVYPGATEEECIPVLEKVSGLKFNEDFFAGYSPERINPGDKEHTVEKILKVTSGSTPEIGKTVDDLYKSVITAGTHLAPTIKVAEAAKVIENSQRDINIAFVNELAKIFNLMDINTHDVLEAAGTKWNFLPFKPGLVGGHCIGVDPYYLAQKAQEYGYHPEIILAGRRMNDSMGAYVASQVVKAMIKKHIAVNGAKVLMLGITFKENCPDVRNTKIVDAVAALKDYGMEVTIYDPWANPEEVLHEYGLECLNELPPSSTQHPAPSQRYDAVVLGVAHTQFLNLDLNLNLKQNAVVYDVKGILASADQRL